MQFQIKRKNLENAVSVAKRVVKREKENNNVYLFIHKEKGIVLFAENPHISTYSFLCEHVDMEKEDPLYYQLSIKELDEMAKKEKGKKSDDMVIFQIEDKKITNLEEQKNGTLQECTPFEIPTKNDCHPFQDEKTFLEIIKESANVLCESKHECSSYLRISSKKAFAMEPKRIHLFAVNEQFEFEKYFIYYTVVKDVLSPSLKKDLAQKWEENTWRIFSNDTMFVLKNKGKILYPPINRTKTEQIACTFQIDAKKVSGVIKKLESESNELLVFSLSEDEKNLVIKSKKDRTLYESVPLESIQGSFETVLFDTKAISHMFASFSKTIEVRVEKYKNFREEEGTMWKIVTPQKTILLGITIETDAEAYYKQQRAL